jgi:glycosyltransferase involved in cell wall biosynthesis
MTEEQASARRPLRILTVGNMYPPHHAGGYELMWQAAVRHARSLGHQVRILTSDYRAAADEPESDPDVHRTLRWYWDLERYQFPELNPMQRLRLERHNARELQGHVSDFEPDIVSWWSMGCMSLSPIELVRRAGIPAVFVVHDDWLVYGPYRDQWLRMWRGKSRMLAPIAERLLGLPTAVDVAAEGRFVFNSNYTLGAARRAGVQPASTTVVYPGVEERFRKPLPPGLWGWRLLYVGRIDRQKGVDTAVRALAELPPESTLVVWGTGDERYVAEMKALAEDLALGDRVRFAGWAGEQELLTGYENADAVVFPVRWEEPFGLVPLEAMGLGRPVIATARGGSAEFLRDEENALVIDADDPAGLARAVERLAADKALRDRLLEGGQATAARFTLERFAEETVQEILSAAAP